MKWKEDKSKRRIRQKEPKRFTDINNLLNDVMIIKTIINYYNNLSKDEYNNNFSKDDYYNKVSKDEYYNNISKDKYYNISKDEYNNISKGDYYSIKIDPYDYFIDVPRYDTPNVYRTQPRMDVVQVHRVEVIQTNPWSWRKKDENAFVYNLYTDNIYYNYCGSDIKRLLILKQLVFNTMERLFRKAKISEKLVSSIFIVDLQKFWKHFYVENQNNLINNRTKHQLCNGITKHNMLRSNDEATLALPTHNKANVLDVLIQRHSLGFKISICKYSIPILLETMLKVYSLSRNSVLVNKSVNVSSVTIGNWYFRNVNQGYLLSILLGNLKINTLNVMRKLYFILITDASPNLTIQINFMLKNRVTTAFENVFTNNSFYESMEWNEHHRNVLTKSSSIITLYFSNTFNNSHYLKAIPAIKYLEPSCKKASAQVVDQGLQTEADNLYTMSYTDVKSPTIASINSYSDVTESSISSIPEELSTDNNSSKAEALPVSSDELPVTIFSHYANFTVRQSKLWLAELCEKSKALGAKLNPYNMLNDDQINETMYS